MADTVEEPEEHYNNDSFVDEPSGESDVNNDDDEQAIDNDPVARIVKQLASSGALIKKSSPRQYCYTCEKNFSDKQELLDHIIEHVSLPSIVLEKIDSDIEDDDEEEFEGDSFSDNENFDEFTDKSIKEQNITLNRILSNKGITITSGNTNKNNPLHSLKNIGNLCIKKVNSDNIKKDDSDTYPDNINAIKKIESSGTLKFTIKQSANNKMFQIINGTNNAIKSEHIQPSSGNSKDDWNPEDNKEGIIENCLNKTIKSEPDAEIDSSMKPKSSIQILENIVIKTEAGCKPPSPILNESNSNTIKVKSVEQMEKEAQQVTIPKPIIIPKVEKDDSNVIEINCDSDKDDDEIIFISSSPVPDKKPPPGISMHGTTKGASITEIPNTPNSFKNTITSPVSNNMPSTAVNSNSHISTEKQHSFNWNAPSKTHDTLESMLSDKSADALLESLLSNHRKDSLSDLSASEYIPLDKLGPQHTCEVCNTRFTTVELFELHKKTTGHSNGIIPSSSSMALSPYQQSGFLSSLLPVKQLAETVSKIASGNSSSSQFTHQQNIMVNIQSFPNQPHGHGYHGVMPPMHPGIPSITNSYQQNYRMPNQNMNSPYPPQYPPTTYPSAYSYSGQQPNYNPGYPQGPMPPPAYPPNQYNSQPNIVQGPYPVPTSQPLNQNQPHLQSNQILLPNSSVIGQNVIPLSGSDQSNNQNVSSDNTNKPVSNGIKIQNIQTMNGSVNKQHGPRLIAPNSIRGGRGGVTRGGMLRPGIRPIVKQGVQVTGQAVRGVRPPMIRGQLKRPGSANAGAMSPSKKRMDMLLPDRHDSEDCQVVSLQQQRDGLPLIQSIQGSRGGPAGVQLSSQITWTKTKVKPPTPPPVNDTSAMASILASRGIKVTPKQKPAFSIPNLGSGISVTPSSKSSSFSILEDASSFSCNSCSKTFSNNNALSIHVSHAHPTNTYKCESCPISYPTFSQLQDHKRVFHNVSNVSELGLPVVDLSQHSTLRRLMNLGITNFIPLANREQGGGCFGVPVVSGLNTLNGTSNNALASLGADGILSLGPIKPLPKC